MHTLFADFQAWFRDYGLWAVFAVLLLENLGLPVPGELALFYGGFQARTRGDVSLAALILVGALASALGQTAGFLLGRYAGPRVRRALPFAPAQQAHVAAFVSRHGPPAILVSRFIVGLRMLAGVIAGLAHMAWRPFMLFNVLGALAWTGAAGSAGWLLGQHWRRLLRVAGRVDVLLAAAAAIAFWLLWRRMRRGEPS
jgi:membrane protein DedA with SNARE-associated domain